MVPPGNYKGAWTEEEFLTAMRDNGMTGYPMDGHVEFVRKTLYGERAMKTSEHFEGETLRKELSNKIDELIQSYGPLKKRFVITTLASIIRNKKRGA